MRSGIDYVRPMANVLVTEEIAEAGLATLRDAGHDVEVKLGLSPDELCSAIAGVHGLVIRSATQVTAEMLEAADSLLVVGRAGVGLDNVDVAASTARGVMVVNAPQSNIVSAAEQTMALLLASARNVPQAHEALKAGRWERSKWTGVELVGKTFGIIGLGRIGALVAERAKAFGMNLVGYDPYINAERAADLGVEILSLDELMATSDFITVHVARTPETIGLINAERLALAKPSLRVINVARGGIVDEADLAVAIADGVIAGAGLDVFATEPCTDSPLFALDQVVVTPHLGASTNEAQDKAGVTIGEQLVLALAGDYVPHAVNIDAAEVSSVAKPFVPLAETLGRLFTSLVETLPDKVEIEFRGEIGGYDNRLAELSFTKGLLSGVSDTPVSYVNADDVALAAGVEIHSSRTTSSNDYVNVITVRGGGHALGATIVGLSEEPHLVMVDDHTIDVPVADHLIVVRNEDSPGMIGYFGVTMGETGINIDDLHLGHAANGEAAMIVASVDHEVGPEVLDALRANPGVHSVVSLSGLAPS